MITHDVKLCDHPWLEFGTWVDWVRKRQRTAGLNYAKNNYLFLDIENDTVYIYIVTLTETNKKARRLAWLFDNLRCQSNQN